MPCPEDQITEPELAITRVSPYSAQSFLLFTYSKE